MASQQPDDVEGAAVVAAAPAVLEEDPSSDASSSSDECAIVALLPFTSKGTKSNTEFSINLPVDHMAATLMAIDHFNTRNPTIVADLASEDMLNCNIQIPTKPGWTILDDGDFTTNSVAALLEADETGEVCAVIGPYRNKAALGAAHVTGAMDVPLISYGAADTAKLGRLHLYPLTIKMTSDEYDRADAVMDYLKNYLGRDYVTLLHTTDLVDHAVKVLDHAAKTHEVEFKTEAITPSKFKKTEGAFSIPNAMKNIQESGHRTVIVALYTGSYWQ